MKNIIAIFILAAASLSVVSCNKDWEEEQFEHYVSFRAPLPGTDRYGVGSGTTPIFVPYTRKSEGVPVAGSGKSSYQLPMIVSGSITNNRDITVHVAHDPDTLIQLNNARFSTRTDLYYKDMGASTLSYASYNESSDIEAGERVGLMNIDFDFNGIDMSDKWVLPIQIVDDGYDYVANPRKNYAKALLRVFPFNDYSGDYAGEVLLYKPFDGNGNPTDASITKSVVRAYVVDDETVFTYAGIVDEDYPNRKLYKIFFKFVPSSEVNGIVEISCPNAEQIGLQVNRQAAYSLMSKMDDVRPYLQHRYVIISNIDYDFNYMLSDNEAGERTYVRYKVVGNMTLGRDVNIQIPDEDQAIEW